jgi:hypothetical protein
MLVLDASSLVYTFWLTSIAIAIAIRDWVGYGYENGSSLVTLCHQRIAVSLYRLRLWCAVYSVSVASRILYSTHSEGAL